MAATHCHNCGAAVDYHFCAVCGQSTILHVPSAGEFIHEFIGHYIALEGRLWKTLVLLLFKPGFLTWEYIQGRRVRYVEPLRLYLTFSILFFAVLKLVGADMYKDDVPAPPKMAAPGGAARPIPGLGAAPATLAGKAASARAAADVADAGSDTAAGDAEDNPGSAPRAAPPLPGLDKDFKLSVGGYETDVSARWKAFMDRPLAERKAIFTTAFFAYVPYALFCLMPLFALYLKLLYLGSGRRYGEHLLFALHANAFAFAVIGMMILATPLDSGLLNFALGAWLLFYLPTAMRRVYGGSRLVTALRWSVLGLLHVTSVFVAIFSAVGWAILR